MQMSNGRVGRWGLGCFTGWLIGSVLGLLLLGLFIVYSLEVAGNLEINMGVNRLDQLPHAGKSSSSAAST